jgi:arsenate reductase (thioredoxin)
MEIHTYIRGLRTEFDKIPVERISALESIGNFVANSLIENVLADLVFICTHNSRRSQFGQIWALTAARYYGLNNVRTFSGGTEETAFNPNAIAALERAGFSVEKSAGNTANPVYSIQSGAETQKSSMFSKKIDDPANPVQNFCAILVCSAADETCPIISGAAERISLPYRDPKDFDGTALERREYDERCREVARDLLWVFHNLSLDR